MLEDGAGLWAPDLLALVNVAGSIEAVPGHFRARVAAAAALVGDADPSGPTRAWEAWCTGEYAICLRQPSPETVVVKESLVSRIDSALDAPPPDDLGFRAALARDVDALDALLRPFARADAMRFGRPTSRERCVAGPRRRWSWLGGSHC